MKIQQIKKIWQVVKILFLATLGVFGIFWPDAFMALRKVFAVGAILLIGEICYEKYSFGKHEDDYFDSTEDDIELAEDEDDIEEYASNEPEEANDSNVTVDEFDAKLTALREEGRRLLELLKKETPGSEEAQDLETRMNGIRKSMAELKELKAKKEAEEEAKKKAEEEAKKKAAKAKAEQEAKAKAKELEELKKRIAEYAADFED